jgi:uncharacterized FAD-dependent dehydrogenase
MSEFRYRVSDLTIPLDKDTPAQLKKAVCAALRVAPEQVLTVKLAKRSVDARKKQDVRLNVTAEVTVRKPLREPLPKGTSKYTPNPYTVALHPRPLNRPLVVGCGPAGLFAALVLAMAGQCPLLIDRGRAVADREADVRKFWQTGVLDTQSNVQFGAGGAGAFSDGKLNTGIKDPRIRFVLEEFVRCGAPEQILTDAKPHVGTDRLHLTIHNLIEKIRQLGGEVCFETTLTHINTTGGKVNAVTLTHKGINRVIHPETVILAVGHSARDTFTHLYEQGISMEAKPFSVGARIEHHQSMIDRAQYGAFAGHKALGAADYKLAVHTPDGRGVYTFCMCPGGTVVAAASEEGMVCTNGMSEFARDKENANAAVLVGISPADFGSDHPLAGMALQRKLERAAFLAGGGGYKAPAQLVGDFLQNRPSVNFGKVAPSYTRGVTPADLGKCLPEAVTSAMRTGLVQMDRSLKGFADPEAVLTGVEARSSSPVRMLRNETGQSVTVQGLYPCGEGAGYAGGITSAAVDGIRCAEFALKNLSV